MVNEETIYMGNTQYGNNNGDVIKKVASMAWKPVAIGGFTGILLGSGALLTQHVFVSRQPAVSNDEVQPKQAQEPEMIQEPVDDNTLKVVTITDDMSFEQAFVEARSQVGPGGVFYWRGVIFSTYTADEWDSMTDEQHEHYAMMVRPEVDANQVQPEDLASSTQHPVEPADAVQEVSPAEDLAVAEATQEEVQAQDNVDADEVLADVPVHEMNEDFILADIREVSGDDVAVAESPVADEDVVIAEQADVIEDIAMIDDIEAAESAAAAASAADVAIAESDDSYMIDEVFGLEPNEDVAMAASKGAPEKVQNDSFEKFLFEDSEVRIVGYGEFDGHVVRGLDLDGDNMVDIAVIDVDDSGDLSRDDLVVEEGSGNMSTYGDLHDFAMDLNHDDMNDNTPNPDVAENMPDYMDDAIAQL